MSVALLLLLALIVLFSTLPRRPSALDPEPIVIVLPDRSHRESGCGFPILLLLIAIIAFVAAANI